MNGGPRAVRNVIGWHSIMLSSFIVMHGETVVDIDTYPVTVHEQIDSEYTVFVIFSVPEDSFDSLRDLSEG